MSLSLTWCSRIPALIRETPRRRPEAGHSSSSVQMWRLCLQEGRLVQAYIQAVAGAGCGVCAHQLLPASQTLERSERVIPGHLPSEKYTAVLPVWGCNSGAFFVLVGFVNLVWNRQKTHLGF